MTRRAFAVRSPVSEFPGEHPAGPNYSTGVETGAVQKLDDSVRHPGVPLLSFGGAEEGLLRVVERALVDLDAFLPGGRASALRLRRSCLEDLLDVVARRGVLRRKQRDLLRKGLVDVDLDDVTLLVHDLELIRVRSLVGVARLIAGSRRL